MSVNQQQWITLGFILILVLQILLWDVFAYLKWGSSATISQTLLVFSQQYPLVYAIGLVSVGITIGHICFSQYLR